MVSEILVFEWTHTYRIKVTLLRRVDETAESSHVVSSGQYNTYNTSPANFGVEDRTRYRPERKVGPETPDKSSL